MQLTEQMLEKYVEFQRLFDPDIIPEKLAESIRADLESEKRDLRLTRVVADDRGEIVAILVATVVAPGTWILRRLRIRHNPDETERRLALDLLPEIVGLACEENIIRIEGRFFEQDMFAEFSVSLERAGFRHLGDRIEFKAKLADLPDDTGSPFEWEAVTDSTKAFAAELLGVVGRGAPDWDPEDDPAQLIEAYLSDPDLICSLDCLHMGLIDGEYAALVIAQVEPPTGWSRITHMGLVPKFRNRGLGKWVHRHGFSMLRSQGGTLYHGGCSMENAAMIRLFTGHGCSEYARFQEWVWKVEGEDNQHISFEK